MKIVLTILLLLFPISVFAQSQANKQRGNATSKLSLKAFCYIYNSCIIDLQAFLHVLPKNLQNIKYPDDIKLTSLKSPDGLDQIEADVYQDAPYISFDNPRDSYFYKPYQAVEELRGHKPLITSYNDAFLFLHYKNPYILSGTIKNIPFEMAVDMYWAELYFSKWMLSLIKTADNKTSPYSRADNGTFEIRVLSECEYGGSCAIFYPNIQKALPPSLAKVDLFKDLIITSFTFADGKVNIPYSYKDSYIYYTMPSKDNYTQAGANLAEGGNNYLTPKYLLAEGGVKQPTIQYTQDICSAIEYMWFQEPHVIEGFINNIPVIIYLTVYRTGDSHGVEVCADDTTTK